MTTNREHDNDHPSHHPHPEQSYYTQQPSGLTILTAVFSLVLVLAAIAGGAYTLGQYGAAANSDSEALDNRVSRLEQRVDRLDRIYERIVRLETQVDQGFRLLHQRLDRITKGRRDQKGGHFFLDQDNHPTEQGFWSVPLPIAPQPREASADRWAILPNARVVQVQRPSTIQRRPIR